jgi:hypothetical protein
MKSVTLNCTQATFRFRVNGHESNISDFSLEIRDGNYYIFQGAGFLFKDVMPLGMDINIITMSNLLKYYFFTQGYEVDNQF